MLSAGKLDDPKPVPDLLKDLSGIVYSDKGYILAPLASTIAYCKRYLIHYQAQIQYEKLDHFVYRSDYVAEKSHYRGID